MGENISQAMQLMAIGMTTVFCVLILIIFFGNVLIKLVNKFIPEEEKKSAILSTANNEAVAIDANVRMAINEAILKLTNGKYKADKVEKL